MNAQTVRRSAAAVWPAVAWLAAFALCAALRASRAYVSAALWGLLLTSSFVAWGQLTLRALRDPRRLGWAFDGTVGMALTLAVFGTLACVRLVSVGAILAWSIAGPVVLAAARARALRAAEGLPPLAWRTPGEAWRLLTSWASRPQPWFFWLGLAVLWAMAALQYVYSVSDTSFNPFDDAEAYRSFIRQFLDTGTLYEPFSYRRIGSYGGSSLLQALVLAFSDRDRVHIADNGIALLLTVGLVTGYGAGGARRAVRGAILAAGLLALTMPYEHHNLGGQISGLVFFLALFRLYDDWRFEGARPSANAALGGMLAAAICTQRQNYFAAATAFVAFVYLARVAYPGQRGRAAWLREAVGAAACALAFLAPWAVLSYINARTAFYPVWKGNIHPEFGIFGTVPRAEELQWALSVMFMWKPVHSIALLFLAAASLPFVRRTRTLQAFLLATTFGFLLMMHFFRTFKDGESILRYLFAFTIAFALAAVLRSFREGARARAGGGARAAMVFAAIAVGTQILSVKDKVLDLYKQRIEAWSQVFLHKGPGIEPGPVDELYKRIQESVPPGEPILVTLDHTYYLDGRRNPIYNHDHPEAIGPRGGVPAFKGPEVFAAYLGSLGIRYVAYVLGTSSIEYQRRYWDGARLAGKAGPFYQRQARLELDFFDNVTALSASRRSVFHEGDVHVLDLQTPAPKP